MINISLNLIYYIKMLCKIKIVQNITINKNFLKLFYHF